MTKSSFGLSLVLFVAIVSVPVAALPAASGHGVVPRTLDIPAGPFIAGFDRAEREAAYRLDEAAYGHGRTRQWRWYESEPVRHTVESGAYAITTTPITNHQYAAFVAATGHPHRFPAGGRGLGQCAEGGERPAHVLDPLRRQGGLRRQRGADAIPHQLQAPLDAGG